uniref:Uncharacterized protein n=1 Tax=Geladintestivirus 5 TaxID=3233137 RepID=A0AAU8MIZ8_9CAUD
MYHLSERSILTGEVNIKLSDSNACAEQGDARTKTNTSPHLWSVRLMVRTRDFHSLNRGSIPLHSTSSIDIMIQLNKIII